MAPYEIFRSVRPLVNAWEKCRKQHWTSTFQSRLRSKVETVAHWHLPLGLMRQISVSRTAILPINHVAVCLWVRAWFVEWAINNQTSKGPCRILVPFSFNLQPYRRNRYQRGGSSLHQSVHWYEARGGTACKLSF